MTECYNIVLKREARPIVVSTRWVLIVLKLLLIPVIVFSQMPLWWLFSAILALLSLVEFRAVRSVPRVEFSQQEIIFKGIFSRKYPWADIENVVLKDDLLTVDFKNNRLFQKEVETGTDERQFNEWAHQKINK